MVRKATPLDADRLGEIHVAGWRVTYRDKLSDAYLFGKHLVVKSTALFRSQIEAGASIWVHEADSLLLGFLWVGPSRDDDLPQHQELYAYYVQPEFKGRGVGTALLQHHFATTDAPHLLWVLKDNPRSVRLYERFGFRADGHEKVEPGWEGILEQRMVRS